MRSGIIGFLLGVIVMVMAVIILQQVVIRAASDDLGYRFYSYVFCDTQFPTGDFEQGRVIHRCLFPARVTITFYDAQYHQVTRADKPGRYGAVVRMNLNGGVVIHRFITLYHTPMKVFWEDGPMSVSAQLPPGTGLNPVVLQNQREEIGRMIKNRFVSEDNMSPDLAILLAGLSETSPDDPPAVARTDVRARDTDWWFGLRQRLGLAERYPYLTDLPQGYDADPGKRWPLILYLHNANQTGHNLQKVRESGLAGLIAQGTQFPAIVISPQCPWYEEWNPRVLTPLLDEVCAKYRVDPDRIYVTGMSIGGDGTWALALAHPDRFAAIVPIAGEFDPADAARIANIPVWTFEGVEDNVAPSTNIVAMVDAIRQAGGHAHLTLYPNTGHDAWDKAYATDALYTWLFAQKRGQPEVVTPGAPAP